MFFRQSLRLISYLFLFLLFSSVPVGYFRTEFILKSDYVYPPISITETTLSTVTTRTTGTTCKTTTIKTTTTNKVTKNSKDNSNGKNNKK